MELKEDVYNRILDLCSQGDDLVEDSKYAKALGFYSKALDLIPEPKHEWEASTWIYTALGDTCYLKGDFAASKNYLFDALNCPDGLDNPFILLRLGESLCELGEVDKAKEYLLRTYMLEGYSIFYSEDDKYFDVIKDDV